MDEIYLDNSATTRPYDAVIEFMGEVNRKAYGNPSSLHTLGLETERLLEEARARIAAVLGCRADEIYFTSGGTEANNLAIKGAAYRHRRRGSHLITTATEHPSVLNCCRQLEREGFTVSYLPVDEQGYVSLGELERLAGPETILVSVLHANNETGTIQPVEKIGALIKQRCPAALFHVDGVQSFAKIHASPDHWQADLFSISAHKIHGPKGTGALWIKKGTLLQPLVQGGDQEKGIRPGTENVAGIAGFGLAAAMTAQKMEQNFALMHALKRDFCRGLREAGLAFTVNGPDPEEGAPHIINLSFPGIKSEVLVHALEKDGVYASPGSACHSRRTEPSHVLRGLGLKGERLEGAVRFSFSGFTTAAQIERVCGLIAGALRRFGAAAADRR